MAHASRSEAVKLHLKKLRIQKIKKREALNKKIESMTEEEKALYYKKDEKTLSEQINLLNWDYRNNQLSRLKYPKFKKLLEQYLEDLNVGSVEWHRINKILKEVKIK